MTAQEAKAATDLIVINGEVGELLKTIYAKIAQRVADGHYSYVSRDTCHCSEAGFKASVHRGVIERLKENGFTVEVIPEQGTQTEYTRISWGS